MFGLGLATNIYIAVDAIDMRKGFEGLHGLVRDHLGQDALSGEIGCGEPAGSAASRRDSTGSVPGRARLMRMYGRYSIAAA